MTEFLRSMSLLLALLNPFLVIVYLLDVVEKVDRATFRRVLIRAGIVASLVFIVFAMAGQAIFNVIVNARFASFQIFGGITFLLIGLQFVFRGPTAIELLRGESAHLAGAIAMPVLIGPGTVSASIVIGERLPPLVAALAIVLAVLVSTGTLLILKYVHDHVRPAREELVNRYVEIAGRITALYVGTVSVEMIMQGLQQWMARF